MADSDYLDPFEIYNEAETMKKPILDKENRGKHCLLNECFYAIGGLAVMMLITLAAYMVTMRQKTEVQEYSMQKLLPLDQHSDKAQVRAGIYSYLQFHGTSDNRIPILSRKSFANGSMTAPAADKVISCYYNTPGPNDAHQLLPQNVHPFLCTHINIAFASIKDKEIYFDPVQNKTIRDLVKLKKINDKLKILLSVGGAGENNGFSEMVVNHASRKVFIRSIKRVLRTFKLDGIDLDWEFPAIHSSNLCCHKRERQHFSQLLREIKAEYAREKRDYLLTVAVAAPETIVDTSYDVDQLNIYADFVNLMTYDFHSFTRITPFTGLNSPLYARPTEHFYMSTLNINYTVQMYLSKGLDKNKIVVGIPTYGHTFTLMNKDNTGIGSPAASYGSLGSLGFVNYPDICIFSKTYEKEVSIVTDKDAKVPYLYRENEWVSYDTPESVREKTKYISDNGLRGAMIYCLNADDYDGVCEGDFGNKIRFPLSETVRNNLVNRN